MDVFCAYSFLVSFSRHPFPPPPPWCLPEAHNVGPHPPSSSSLYGVCVCVCVPTAAAARHQQREGHYIEREVTCGFGRGKELNAERWVGVDDGLGAFGRGSGGPGGEPRIYVGARRVVSDHTRCWCLCRPHLGRGLHWGVLESNGGVGYGGSGEGGNIEAQGISSPPGEETTHTSTHGKGTPTANARSHSLFLLRCTYLFKYPSRDRPCGHPASNLANTYIHLHAQMSVCLPVWR